MAKAHYLNVQNVRKLCKDHDKYASQEFVSAVDRLVETAIKGACATFNGHKKRLGSELLAKRFQV